LQSVQLRHYERKETGKEWWPVRRFARSSLDPPWWLAGMMIDHSTRRPGSPIEDNGILV